MNLETIAALSPCHGLFDAKMIEAVNKFKPLAGINISPGTLRMCSRLADIVTPELVRSMASLERHTKIAKLADSILPLPSRR